MQLLRHSVAGCAASYHPILGYFHITAQSVVCVIPYLIRQSGLFAATFVSKYFFSTYFWSVGGILTSAAPISLTNIYLLVNCIGSHLNCIGSTCQMSRIV